LVTLQSFTTPQELLQKLIQRYRVPDSVSEQKKNLVQARVCIFLKRWIEKCPLDIENLIPTLNEFFDQEMTRDGYTKVIPTLRKTLTELVIIQKLLITHISGSTT
jgi:hypothetical protein